ncbi:hypothetical protein [Pedobacter sp. UYP1]|uniref:hypothetical protein n=1 Tax=Pedobacter sp. UYP1 TaxID=1756396 RepID=UPI0033923B59
MEIPKIPFNNYQLVDLKRIEDYKQEVILAYKKRKDEGLLPPNLQYHTPANLRKECLAVFHKRYSKKDEETFKLLLDEERSSAEEYFKKIQITSADKFKPLDNFLKGNTGDTKVKNIELLAWLIDFQPRPHVYADVYDLVNIDRELSIRKEKDLSGMAPPSNRLLGNNSSGSDSPGNSSLTSDQKIGKGRFGIPTKFNKAVISFVAVLVIVGGSYFFYDTNTQCMYWNGDEYQSVTCDQNIEGIHVIPKDASRLKQLKRIKNIAEITREDIGKVHYSKVNGQVEFYTAGGENPTDSRKRLLPLSEHMFIEYIEGNKQ